MSDGAPTAAAAFALLGNETRLAIVEELAVDGYQGLEPTDGRSFADLRRAVGVDDAGRFNYHLGELLGTFVRKVGEGYALTNAGWTVAGIVAAEEVGGGDVRREEPLDTPCPWGDTLVGTYEEGLFRVECSEHGVLFATRLPTGVVRERSLDEVLTIACDDMQADIDRAVSGVCPHCRGDIAVSLTTGTTVQETGIEAPVARCDCGDCGLRFEVPPGVVVVSHPAVVSFYYDHGVDLRTRTYPELPFLDATAPTVVATDPTRVRIDVEHDGDTLRIVLDGDARVVEAERG
jgi:hypothetical protein